MLENKTFYFLDIPWDKDDCIKTLFEKGECVQHSVLSFYYKKSQILHSPIKIKEEIKDDDLLLIYCNYEDIKEFIGFTRLLLKNSKLIYSLNWPPFKNKSGGPGIKWYTQEPYEYPYDFFKVSRYGGDQDYPHLYELDQNETRHILGFLHQNVANWNEIVEKIEGTLNR